MDEKAIYDFHGLKKTLESMGFHVGKAETWRPIDSEEVSLKEGNLIFDDDGIFLVDDKGYKRQVFLYKREYRLIQYGKPRYHICKCETIESFLRGMDIPEYRRAETKSVKVINRDNNNEEEVVSDLPLCQNCAKKVFKGKVDMSSSEFAEILRNAAPAEQPNDKTEINPRGYTKDWSEISRRYREEHNYTCEKCGVQVSPFETEYMQVHHKNGNKTDNNRISNLQCLCIKCHSEVDPTHIHNFSSESQRLLIKLFMEKYGSIREKNLKMKENQERI